MFPGTAGASHLGTPDLGLRAALEEPQAEAVAACLPASFGSAARLEWGPIARRLQEGREQGDPHAQLGPEGRRRRRRLLHPALGPGQTPR